MPTRSLPSARYPWLLAVLAIVLLAGAPAAFARSAGVVAGHAKISDTAGGFGGVLDDFDSFGFAATALGDVDGDGVTDIAVGAPQDDDGGNGRGAVWVLFMNADGSVASHQKISSLAGDFAGALGDGDTFGAAVAGLGDLDDDGVPDLAVGAPRADTGGVNRGTVWILFLESDGTVREHREIAESAGGFEGSLDDNDGFGTSVAAIGDLGGDGVVDLAVGATGDDDGGVDRGALWILHLTTAGLVAGDAKISDTAGGFTGVLGNTDLFGSAVTRLDGVDLGGVIHLAVGAFLDDDGGPDRGAVWLLALASDGSVTGHGKISATAGGFAGPLDDQDFFGFSVGALGDIDGDGIAELAVGAIWDDDGNTFVGAVWVLSLDTGGAVVGSRKISATAGGFTATLGPSDFFGTAAAPLGDHDGDGTPDLAVGARFDDDGGTDRGAVWILHLAASCPADLDRGGGVDFVDLLIVLNAWGRCDGCVADITGDGLVDFLDLLEILARWGDC